MAHCAACRASMDEVRDVLDACDDALRHPAPVDGYEALRDRLAAADLAMAVPLREELRPSRFTAVAGIAAALAIVIGASSPFVTSRFWYDPLERAVDEAVLGDMSSVDRESEGTDGWRPAEELLGDDGAWEESHLVPAVSDTDGR